MSWVVIAILCAAPMLGCVRTYDMQQLTAAPDTTTTIERECPAPEPGITWYVPASQSDGHELDRWCRATGPVVLDTVPSRHFGAWQRGDSLLVAVWNIAAGSGDILPFIREQLGFDCETGYFLESRGHHFVILLQEALRSSGGIPADPESPIIAAAVAEEDRPGPRLDVVEVARRCGLAVAYVAATRNGTLDSAGVREDKGNAILSTLPLSDVIGLEEPAVAQRRVSVGATVRNAAGDSLRLVSLHINTFPGPWRILWTGASSRLRQSLAIVTALRDVEIARAPESDRAELARCHPYCVDDGVPTYPISTIAAGDLNTSDDSESAIQHLREHFPDSPPPHGEATSRQFPTDHLLFRRRTGSDDSIRPDTYRVVESKYYSDHNAVIGWFAFGN